VKTPGICALLCLKPSTSHNLPEPRPHWQAISALTLRGFPKCPDHATTRKGEQIAPTVTGRVYNHSKRMKEERVVLDGVAAELRRIIGEPSPSGSMEFDPRPDRSPQELSLCRRSSRGC